LPELSCGKPERNQYRKEANVFNSGVLDVAVGLTFVYLLLALVCTAVNEIFEAKLRLRARDLERGIRELLGGKDQIAFTKQFYDHPLIYSLYLKSYKEEDVDRDTGRYKHPADLPSYIPRRNFALALMDLMLPAKAAGTAAASGTAGATPAAPAPPAPQPPGAAVVQAPPSSTLSVLPLLRDAIARTDNEKLKGALLPLVDAAAGNVAVARANIEDWFDSAMDRVSGWYKRRVQIFILWIALAVTVATNADTITIANSLSRDVSMRNALVAAAGEYAKAGTTPAQPVADRSEKLPECKQDAGSPECRVAMNLSQISRLGLPVGWRRDDPRSVPSGAGGWLTKILGLLLTAIAISLGAPFWFDVLNKIIVVRSTVKPKEKSPDEPPIDRPKR
jgi:hypothetical protein